MVSKSWDIVIYTYVSASVCVCVYMYVYVSALYVCIQRVERAECMEDCDCKQWIGEAEIGREYRRHLLIRRSGRGGGGGGVLV